MVQDANSFRQSGERKSIQKFERKMDFYDRSIEKVRQSGVELEGLFFEDLETHTDLQKTNQLAK